MEIQATMNIKNIKPNPGNPRTIKDDNFKKLVKSIKDFPEMLDARPLVLNKDNVILGGNMRYKAAVEAGLTELPVKIVDWPEDKQREFIIKDNVSGGEWDWDILANEWDTDLLDDWGLELPDSIKEETEVEEDEAPEVSSEPPVSQLGSIYQLGRHFVMCGDSTDKASVELLMNGVKADMVYTDPPYGMSLDVDYDSMFKNDKSHKNTGERFDAVIDDDKYFDPRPILAMVSKVPEVFLWGADYFYDSLPRGGSLSAWDKRTETLDAVVGNTTEFLWSKQPHRRMTARVLWSGHHGMGKDDEKSRIHPTQKPLELHKWFFDNYGNGKSLVLDLFLGSGSTLIACEQTDRTCYGMELDPKYVDVIRKRYAKFIDPNGWEESWQTMTPAIN